MAGGKRCVSWMTRVGLAPYGSPTLSMSGLFGARERRRDLSRGSHGVVFLEGSRNCETSWTRGIVERLATAYTAAVRMGLKIDALSAGNGISTAGVDTGQKTGRDKL